MLKRFMTWLLNQFQKVINTFKKGPQPEKDNKPSAIANRLSSDLSSQRQSNIDDPVALREPFPASVKDTQQPDLVAIPSSAEQQQTALSLTQPDVVVKKTPASADTNVDIHQKLDIASTVLPEASIAAPAFPAEVSELISSGTNSATQSSSAYEDEQTPEIHDLLPAVEADEREGTSTEPTVTDFDEAEEATELPEAPQLSTPNASTAHPPTQNQSVIDVPLVESAARVSNKEEITLFSFNITETEENVETSVKVPKPPIHEEEYQATERADNEQEDQANNYHPSLIEEKVKAKEHQESIDTNMAVLDTPSVAPDQSASEFFVNPEETKTSQTDQPEVLSNSTAAKDEPINPWLTAISTKHQTPETTVTVNQPTEQEQKTGTVKLLFKIKQGNFHGYIAPDDGSKDILFHQKYINADIFDQIERGSEVVASIKYMEGKVYATHVALS